MNFQRLFTTILYSIVVVFVFLLLSLHFSSDVSARVVINEFSSSTSSDWIELYAYEDMDISGWILDDDGTETNMTSIPQGIIIGPSSSAYYVVEVSNRLNKTGDIIKLLKEDMTMVDEVSYGNKGGVCIPSELGSVARIPDANPHFYRLLNNTKGQSNGDLVTDPCPTPTPEPDPTSTPTPKPTKTPVPTKTPTPKPTKKVTKAPTQKIEEGKEDEDDEIILGLRNELESDKEEEGENEKNEEKRKFPFGAVLMILGGMSFMGGAGYLLFKDKLPRYNLKNVFKRFKKSSNS